MAGTLGLHHRKTQKLAKKLESKTVFLPEIQPNGDRKWGAGVGPFFTTSYDVSVRELCGWIALNSQI